MKKVLEDLWYHYLTEVVVERSDKEAEIIKECEMLCIQNLTKNKNQPLKNTITLFL